VVKLAVLDFGSYKMPGKDPCLCIHLQQTALISFSLLILLIEAYTHRSSMASASALFATAALAMALMLAGGSTCHAARHLADTTPAAAPAAVPGIPAVPKPQVPAVALTATQSRSRSGEQSPYRNGFRKDSYS